MKNLVLLIFFLSTRVFAQSADPSTVIPVITAQNGNQLHPVYGYPGECHTFSPDSSLLYVEIFGVFETYSGRARFATPHAGSRSTHLFSPDGTLLAVAYDGLYDISSGTRTFPFTGVPRGFSPDGSMLATLDGIYDTQSGQMLFATVDGGPISPDGQYVISSTEIGGEIQVIQLFEQQTILTTPAGAYTFSPDSRFFYVAATDAPARVYRLADGELIFEVSAPGLRAAAFSPDSTLMAVPSVGVYDTQTWEQRFAFDYAQWAGEVQFSPDGRYVAMGGNGLYDVGSGSELFPIENSFIFGPNSDLLVLDDGLFTISGEYLSPLPTGQVIYSPDGKLIAVTLSQSYDVREGSSRSNQACIVYAIDDGTWMNGIGLIHISDSSFMRSIPDGDILTNITGTNVVFAISEDQQWLAVFASTETPLEDTVAISLFGWIPATDVEIQYLSEQISTDLRTVLPVAWLEALPRFRVLVNERTRIVVGTE